MRQFANPLLIAFILVATFAHSQGPSYAKLMKSALHVHDTASNYSSEQAAASAFERTAELFPDEWLPNYWASYVYTQLHNSVGLPDAPKGITKKKLMDKAQQQFDLAKSRVKTNSPEIESDLHALQAFIHYFNGIDAKNKELGKPFFDKYAEEIKLSLKSNPNNPLVSVIIGTEMVSKKDDISSIIAGRALLNVANQEFKKSNQPRALTTSWNHEWLWLFWLNYADKQLKEAIANSKQAEK